MYKVALLGGLSFLGRNIIENLKDEFDFIILNRSEDSAFIKKHALSFYSTDFTNIVELKEIFEKEKPHFLINFISEVTAARDLEIFKTLVHSNVDLLMNIFHACSGLDSLKLFINMGSGEEYGNIRAPFSETDREAPNSPYSAVKQLMTNTLLMLYNNYRFPVTIVRPANVFGKHQNSDKFLPYVIDHLKNGRDINTTQGEQKRDFIYAPVFTSHLASIINNYSKITGQIINIGSGEAHSLKDIILYCKDVLKSNSKLNLGALPYRENECMHFELDISKLEKMTNQKRSTTFFQDLKIYLADQ